MRKSSNLVFLILAVLLIAPSLVGIFHKGFFLSDDGNWMVIRFSAFYDALKNGQFPVRFLSRLNNGYGYPVADFLYPLFMYIGVPVHLLKFNFVDTIKIIFAASMISSSIFSFLWLRKLFDNLSSLIGSVVYSLFPYHLWDMYKRGSIGEVLALSIVPFILWSVEKENILLTGIGYGLLIVAHNSLALLFLPVLCIYQLLRNKLNKKEIFKIFYGLCLGFLLSAFFWLPALYDKQFTVFDKTNVSDFALYFISPANYELFGIVFVLSLVVSLFFIHKKDKRFIYFFVVNIVAFLLTIPQSLIIWQKAPFVNFIQFPFRLISIIVLGTAYLAAAKLSFLKGKIKILFLIGYLIIVYVSAGKFLFPANYQYYADTFYSTNQDSTTVKNEYMPKWVKKIPVTNNVRAQVINGQERLNILSVTPNKISIRGYFATSRTVQINTVYFPGWSVLIDGKSVPIDYNSNGLIRINVSAGSHALVARFGETPIRLFADLLSGVGLLIALFLFVYRKIKK